MKQAKSLAILLATRAATAVWLAAVAAVQRSCYPRARRQRDISAAGQ